MPRDVPLPATASGPEALTMFLQEIVDRIPGLELTGDPTVRIGGICCDSRAVKSGFLFVAIRGEKTDGMRFLRQAVDLGASAFASEDDPPDGLNTPALKVPDARRFLAEVSRLYYLDPSSELKLAAVTGTNGKTTTTYLLESIFRKAGLRSCVVGTVGMRIGDRMLPSLHTTPEASDLLSFLRQAVTSGCTHGALEVSSHALVLRRVYGVGFNVGVFTNLTPDHLDFHRDMESYFQAKRLLFVPEGGNRIACAVVNADDAYGRRLSYEVSCRLIRYGFAAGGDIRAVAFESRVDGTDLRMTTLKGELGVRSRLVGRPNVYNIMAATGAALALDIGLDAIRAGIEALEGVPGRMELIDTARPFTLIVDYAHTPDALENLLETASALPHGKVIIVFGCGGDRDRSKRRAMGEIAGRKSDFVVATSDNPRTEDPLAILEEIEAGLVEASGQYKLVPDRREAIKFALSQAGKGDVVLIAGKGHETRQIIGTQALPFDDRVVARELARELPTAHGGRN